MRYLLFSIVAMFFLGTIACSETEESTPTESTVEINKNNAVKEPKVPEGFPVGIKGTVTGLKEGQKLYFDKKTIDATEIVDNVVLDANGSFELKTAVKEPGIYRMRLGIKAVYMLLEGGEDILLSANVEGYDITEYKLEGGLYAEEMAEWANETDAGKIAKYLEKATESKPLLHLYLVEKLDVVEQLNLYKKVRDELVAKYPSAAYANQFNSKVLTVEAEIKSKPAALGDPAPEINLPNPDGKKMALSELKGKVVLIDFWASWCRPCRMANPHVVKIYEKFNKKGFEVFSVSFDGLDDRRLSMHQGNQQSIAQDMENQKKAWIKAIADDKLSWKYHVSELRSWSSQIARVYGVNSIPRTFLLDKKGVIRYDNLPPNQLEGAIKKLLAEK